MFSKISGLATIADKSAISRSMMTFAKGKIIAPVSSLYGVQNDGMRMKKYTNKLVGLGLILVVGVSFIGTASCHGVSLDNSNESPNESPKKSPNESPKKSPNESSNEPGWILKTLNVCYSELNEEKKRLEILNQKLEKFMEAEKDNPLYETAIKISELELPKFQNGKEKGICEMELEKIYRNLLSNFEENNHESNHFDTDIGPYLVEECNEYGDDYLKIVHNIHNKYLQMDPEQKKKEFRKFCAKFVTALKLTSGWKDLPEYEFVIYSDASKFPFPEIREELEELFIKFPHLNYKPVFEILGNFCLFGINHLYSIICLKHAIHKANKQKNIYQEIYTDMINHIEMVRKYLRLMITELTFNQLLKKIEIDIKTSGFQVIIPYKSQAECMNLMQKVIEEIPGAKDYLIEMGRSGSKHVMNASDPMLYKIYYHPLIEPYLGITAHQSIVDLICIYAHGYRPWITIKLRYLTINDI